MRTSQPAPVTVKCRIGIDDQDEEADFQRFIDVVAAAGCTTFVVHARKAWLKGLSPKENREVPPLDYARVYRLKAARPDLEIVLNGGIESVEQAQAHLEHVDGVMLGRAAYQNPFVLAEVDRDHLRRDLRRPDARRVVLTTLIPYVEDHLRDGGRLSNITRHVLGLYHRQPRGRAFRRLLSEEATRSSAGVDVLRAAIELAEFGLDRDDQSRAA